jgi:integrase
VRTELDDWLAAAAIDRGKLFRRVNKVGRTWGDCMTVKAVWHIVKESAKRIGVAKLAPHDLRRYAESRTMPNQSVTKWLQACEMGAERNRL